MYDLPKKLSMFMFYLSMYSYNKGYFSLETKVYTTIKKLKEIMSFKCVLKNSKYRNLIKYIILLKNGFSILDNSLYVHGKKKYTH